MSTVSSKDSLLSLEDVLDSTGGVLLHGGSSFCFKDVQTDSRNVVQSTLFVPLVGEVQDGHKYIPSALKSGASVVFVQNGAFESDKSVFEKYFQEYPEAAFIGVENNLTALQHAAARYVEKFPKLIRIGVTGSSGKTTTKEITAALLGTKYKVIANKGNLNSETGLPLSVFTIRPEHEVGLFEMGMNRKDEIAELAFVLKPQHAIITNIGTAHVGMLGSRDNIAHEKTNIFNYFDSTCTAVIPSDDDYASYMEQRASKAGRIFFYGDNAKDSPVKFEKDLGLMGTEFSVEGKHVVLPIPGKYNYKNAQAAVTLALSLGISADDVAKGIAGMPHLFGRSEVRNGKYTIVQDCYNANPDSMTKALELCSEVELPEGKQRVFVLGDMLELGSDSENAHSNAGALAACSDAALICFVGEEMKYAYDTAMKTKKTCTELVHFPSKDDESIEKLCSLIKEKIVPGSLVLVKASRGMQLERVTKLLEGENN